MNTLAVINQYPCLFRTVRAFALSFFLPSIFWCDYLYFVYQLSTERHFIRWREKKNRHTIGSKNERQSHSMEIQINQNWNDKRSTEINSVEIWSNIPYEFIESFLISWYAYQIGIFLWPVFSLYPLELWINYDFFIDTFAFGWIEIVWDQFVKKCFFVVFFRCFSFSLLAVRYL